MGHCITTCNNNLNRKGEFNIRNVFNGMAPDDFAEKFKTSPNYPLVIFLQTRMKKQNPCPVQPTSGRTL